MKKLLFCFILFFSFNYSINAEKLEVKLDKCVDGDTAWFILDNKTIKTRFLAINAPESTSKVEPYGKDASNFTCNALKNANKIEIEYDPNSDKFDKYDRHLVWIFIDNKLLQNEIVKNGYANIDYIYGEYLYTDILEDSLNNAKINKLGMWETSTNYYTSLIIVILLLILICLFSTSARKAVINKAREDTIKGIKKIIKKNNFR